MSSRLQVPSESTLEQLDGVLVVDEGPPQLPTAPLGIARFVALRSLWLRQVNSLSGLQRIVPSMPTSLRCAPHVLA